MKVVRRKKEDLRGALAAALVDLVLGDRVSEDHRALAAPLVASPALAGPWVVRDLVVHRDLVGLHRDLAVRPPELVDHLVDSRVQLGQVDSRQT